MHLRTLTLLATLPVAAACATTSRPVPEAWMSVPRAPRIDAIALAADGKVVTAGAPAAQAADKTGPIHVVTDAVGPKLANGEKVLTDPFLAIDSFDLSEARGEVVFSAKRDDDFDIGLVSSDGSPVNWVPPDPADEVAVQWAPRGSKISYVIRANGGDVVRTLHVPTSFQFAVPFSYARIHALAWDPPAERYAVAYSTLSASDAVDVLKYSGEERKTAIPAAASIDADLEPFPPHAMLLRPRSLRYEEKVPVVVWLADDYRWSDERAALMKNARVAVLVTRSLDDAALWDNIAATPWLDGGRLFVVAPRGGAISKGTVIVADQALAGGRYRRNGRVVAVSPAVVQSFAAGFIADQLKRTTPTNGSSR